MAKTIDFNAQNVMGAHFILSYWIGYIVLFPTVADVELYYCETFMKIEFEDIYPQIY